jgi:DNA invertase Pin-like site-specific DNA recombinase
MDKPFRLSDATPRNTLEINRTPGGRIVGLVRRSATELAWRILTAAGADHILMAERIRPGLAFAMAALRPGDVLAVTSPSALARGPAELLTIVAELAARNVALVILSVGGERLDTRSPIGARILSIIAGVATWEREIMLEGQREGIGAGAVRVPLRGRPVSIDAAEIKRLSSEMGPAAIAKRLGIARSSVYRLLTLDATASSIPTGRSRRSTRRAATATPAPPASMTLARSPGSSATVRSPATALSRRPGGSERSMCRAAPRPSRPA